MAIFKRRNDVAAQVEAARASLDGINGKIAELSRTRADRLLDSDDMAPVQKLDDEITVLRHTAGLYGQRIAALQGQLDKLAAEQRAREHQELIGRVEKKLGERDQAGAELARHLAAAEKAFRKLLALNDEISAAWPFTTQDRIISLLNDRGTKTAVEHELFRIGHQPFVGGNSAIVVRPSFPGGRSPDVRLAGLPEAIKPLADVMREASAYAVQIMRGGRLEPIDHAIELAAPEALRPDLSGPRVSAKEVQAMIPKQILGV